MSKSQVMQLLSLAAMALMFMPSPWGHVQGAALSDFERRKYCMTILNQTEAQEKNCVGAPNVRIGTGNSTQARATFRLLCCIGTFPTHKVNYNYTVFMDRSLASYILNNIMSPADEVDMATYIQDCYSSTFITGRKLSSDDYKQSFKSPHHCQSQSP